MSGIGEGLRSGAVALAKTALIRAGYERRMAEHPFASQAAGLALLRASSDLRSRGWFGSFVRRVPEDASGAPLPWFTYAAIAFLEPRVQADWRVFEYGSGHSTLWWAARVREVVAAEHHAGWAARIAAKAPANARVLHRDLTDGTTYPDTPVAALAEGGGPFDVIVIDGRERVWCAERCLDALSPSGVILWDNSERPRYRPGLAALAEAGFRHVDFDGMGPVNPYGWRTTVLYRDDNVLGL